MGWKDSVKTVNYQILTVVYIRLPDVDSVNGDQIGVLRRCAMRDQDVTGRDEGSKRGSVRERSEVRMGVEADRHVEAEGGDVGGCGGGHVEREEGGVGGSEESVGGVGVGEEEGEADVGGGDGVAEEVVAARSEGGDGGVELGIGDGGGYREGIREKEKEDDDERVRVFIRRLRHFGLLWFLISRR